MSSGAILGEIRKCESQIAVTGQKVTFLNDKVEMQEYAVRAFAPRVDDFFCEISEKSSQANFVAGYDPKAVVSVRFRESMDAVFFANKGNAAKKAEEMMESMRRELQNTVDLLESTQSELRRLKSCLAALHAEYQAALAHEEAERQAAAAAAARA